MADNDFDPWAEPDGAELLDDLLATLKRYVVFPDEYAAIGVTLWIAVTHALPAFEHASRLVINSPQKRCGKSRLLDVITGTCHNPLPSVNATVAAIYRSLGGDHPPTLVIDEADALFGTRRQAEQNEDLRALLNAGHQRERPVLRCVGGNQTPTPFPTFAMVALAGIGAMPDTITDRAVNIHLRRRAPGEVVSQFRTRRDGPVLAELRDRLATWATGQLESLREAEPNLPVEDRAADTWEPLVAIADAAGGPWPERVRMACKVLTSLSDSEDEEGSVPLTLLVDIRQVFADKEVDFLPSSKLIGLLRRMEESPWDEFELTVRKLAQRLKGFGVKSQKSPDGSVRGYYLRDFADVFQRYTRPVSEP